MNSKTVKNERPTIAKPMVIRDVTGEEDKYTLDRNGFHFCRWATLLRGDDFHDSELVQAKYYPEAEQLLKDMYYPPLIPIQKRKWYDDNSASFELTLAFTKLARERIVSIFLTIKYGSAHRIGTS